MNAEDHKNSCMKCKYSRQGKTCMVCRHPQSYSDKYQSIYWTDTCDKFEDSGFDKMTEEEKITLGYKKREGEFWNGKQVFDNLPA